MTGGQGSGGDLGRQCRHRWNPLIKILPIDDDSTVEPRHQQPADVGLTVRCDQGRRRQRCPTQNPKRLGLPIDDVGFASQQRSVVDHSKDERLGPIRKPAADHRRRGSAHQTVVGDDCGADRICNPRQIRGHVDETG